MDDQRASGVLEDAQYGVIASVLTYDASPLVMGFSWAASWWPGGFGIGEASILDNVHYGSPYPVSGVNGRLALLGYTRDAYGSPLPLATVKLFRTVDDSLQNTVVSDGSGLYSVTSPYADGHYLVVYKAGPPDVCGTTINTLAPG